MAGKPGEAEPKKVEKVVKRPYNEWDKWCATELERCPRLAHTRTDASAHGHGFHVPLGPTLLEQIELTVVDAATGTSLIGPLQKRSKTTRRATRPQLQRQHPLRPVRSQSMHWQRPSSKVVVIGRTSAVTAPSSKRS
jgi:hypothetical protein